MTISFIDLKRVFEYRQDEYEQAILEALRSGRYVLGEYLSEFENDFASYIGMSHGVGVNSGQDSLILAIRALGIGEGDEVIVQSNAYIASVFGITENGATPVFVEPDDYFGMDPDAIEDAITERTRAILPVHLYGQICDMARIQEIARKHGLYVVEDCAQCHGAMQNDRKAGSFSDISCFSFYPTKPLGALGDGGMCLTNDASLAEKLRMLRYYGSRKKYESEIEGVNSRLDEIQAAVLSKKLQHLDEDNAERRKIAQQYLDGINNPRVELPAMRPESSHVFHLFPVLCEDRDDLSEHLSDLGVLTSIHYPIPPHLQECYRHFGFTEGMFPKAERFASQELSLPIYTGMPESDVEYVIDAINKF